LILPKSIRSAHNWLPGTEFSVEDRDDGIVLKPVRRRGIARWDDLVGLARYKGRRKTISEMDTVIAAEGRKHR
jgi:AbrB family looped-hinge helix DNA binding protein